MSISLNEYFKRINYNGSTDVSVETLKQIHTHQIFSIPFENLEIHEQHNINNPNNFIKLDANSLFDKLVARKRGGYCHENNELLALVLNELGFEVKRLVARVLHPDGLPKGHKLLLVTIQGQNWVADAGFGGYGLFEPIPLIANLETEQFGDCFMLSQNQNNYILQIKDKNNGWKPIYEFNLNVLQPIDYLPLSYHVSHDPNSIFVTNRICVMSTPQGRIILNNTKLKITDSGKEMIKEIKEGNEYLATLKEYFGIEFPSGTKFKDMPVSIANQITLGFSNHKTHASSNEVIHSPGLPTAS